MQQPFALFALAREVGSWGPRALGKYNRFILPIGSNGPSFIGRLCVAMATLTVHLRHADGIYLMRT